MLYLLYGETPSPIDAFIESLLQRDHSLKRVVVDEFKDLDRVRKIVLQSDSLFGEKKLLVFREFPKAKLSFLEDLIKLKGEVDIALCFLGEQLSLAKVMVWVKAQGGVVKEFKSFKGKAIFKFLDAVGGRNLKLAVVNLKKMKEEGESIFLALAFLFTRLEKLVLAKEDTGSRLHRLSSAFSCEELFALQESLLMLEAKLKSESVDAWEEVENWLVLTVRADPARGGGSREP